MNTEFIRVSGRGGNSFFGMNGGCPESFDGKRLVYAYKADLAQAETGIMICNSRKVIAQSMVYTRFLFWRSRLN